MECACRPQTITSLVAYKYVKLLSTLATAIALVGELLLGAVLADISRILSVHRYPKQLC